MGSHTVRIDEDVAAEIYARAIPGESVNETVRRVIGLDPAPGGFRRGAGLGTRPRLGSPCSASPQCFGCDGREGCTNPYKPTEED